NLQVTRRFSRVFFRPGRSGQATSPGGAARHRLGGLWFGLMWYSTLLLPAFMLLASAALIGLWFLHQDSSAFIFTLLWIFHALAFVFTTTFSLLLDRGVARRSWFQAITFPGLVNLVIMLYALAPLPMSAAGVVSGDTIGVGWN